MTNFSVKEKIFLTVAVVMVVLLSIVYTYKVRTDNALHAALNANDSVTQTMRTYYDANGKLHAQIEVMQVDKTLYTEMNKKYLDSFARVLGIKVSNIGSMVSTVTRDTGHIHSKVDTQYIIVKNPAQGNLPAKEDSVEVYDIHYKDQGLVFDGRLEGDDFDATYALTDSLALTTYQKGTGFLGLGKKKSYLDISSSNKNVSFLNARDVELTKIKDKRWSVGPSLQYNLFSNKVDVGVSVQYGLFKF